MKIRKIYKNCRFLPVFLSASLLLLLYSCSSFNYKTYDEKTNANVDDPEPDYDMTMDKDFQDFTNFMFIGNRIENFGTYFNTYYNAKENFDDAYDDYTTIVLANYSNRLDSINAAWPLGQQTTDLFNKAIEKCSKVIQYHKSSAFMDRAVLLIGKCYYYLGDYIKAERKFGEFVSKLPNSTLADENKLFYSRTELKLGNYTSALQKLDEVIKNTKSNVVRADAYQTVAEYYLSRKDYDDAVANYKKAIEYSKDSQFKAQMQFLLATVIAKKDNRAASVEFDKVLDFSPTYDLEYYARLNRLKYLILSNNFSEALPIIDNMRAKYKDNPDFAGQVDFLQGYYWEQKKDIKKAIDYYYQVINNFPKTQASSNASYQIARNFELEHNDYLNALRYYRYSTEESGQSTNYLDALNKVKLFKRYFDLRSVIVGKTISVDYDSVFIKKTQNTKTFDNGNPQNTPPKDGDHGKGGKEGGMGGYIVYPDNIYPEIIYPDSLQNIVDSAAIKTEQVAKAKFELAEFFDYEFKQKDSSEFYYLSAFEETNDYDFKSKVLYALSGLYRSTGNSAKADDVLHRIINEYPLSPITNEAKKELNIPVEEVSSDASDSLFNYSESRFSNSDYTPAMAGYKQLLSAYPNSVHTNKVKYSIGWIYENILFKPDSAYMYYSEIIAASPKSEFTAVIQPKIKEYEDAHKKIDSTQIDSSKINEIKKDSTGTGEIKKDSTNSINGEIKSETDVKKVEQGDTKDPLKTEEKPDIIKEDEKKGDDKNSGDNK